MATTSVAQFTPPTSCLDQWWGLGVNEGALGVRNGAICVDRTLTDDEACVPPTATVTECPLSWTPAATTSATTICCSSKYSWSESAPSLCFSKAGRIEVTALYCRSEQSSPGTYTVSLELESPYVIAGPTVAFVAARTSSLAIGRTTLPPPTTFAAGASNSSQSRNSLSGGTIAGIVVGLIAAFVIILSSIFLLWRRKHSQAYDSALQDQLPEFISGTYYDRKRELDATEKCPGVTQEPSELPVASSMHESGEVVEMAGGD